MIGVRSRQSREHQHLRFDTRRVPTSAGSDGNGNPRHPHSHLPSSERCPACRAGCLRQVSSSASSAEKGDPKPRELSESQILTSRQRWKYLLKKLEKRLPLVRYSVALYDHNRYLCTDVPKKSVSTQTKAEDITVQEPFPEPSAPNVTDLSGASDPDPNRTRCNSTIESAASFLPWTGTAVFWVTTESIRKTATIILRHRSGRSHLVSLFFHVAKRYLPGYFAGYVLTNRSQIYVFLEYLYRTFEETYQRDEELSARARFGRA